MKHGRGDTGLKIGVKPIDGLVKVADAMLDQGAV